VMPREARRHLTPIMPGGNAHPLLAGRFRRFSRMVSLLASVEYRTAHRHSKRSGRLAGMMSADGRRMQAEDCRLPGLARALSEEPRRDSRIVRRVIRSILLQRVIRRVDCI